MCNAFGGEYCNTANEVGGGGGGAGGAGGTVGTSSSNRPSGAGGAGLASSITGTSVTRAAGGTGRGDAPRIQPTKQAQALRQMVVVVTEIIIITLTLVEMAL